MIDERDRAVEAEDQTKQAMAELEQVYHQAERARDQAESETQARQRALARQLLSDTELMRVSTAIPNRREQGLERLRDAAAPDPAPARAARLRDEVAALLDLRDVEARFEVAAAPMAGLAVGEGATAWPASRPTGPRSPSGTWSAACRPPPTG